MKEDNSFKALMKPGEAENFFDVAGLAPFEPNASAVYSRTNAIWLMEFSRLIYRREANEGVPRLAGFKTRNDFLSAHGWREDAFFDKGSTQAAIFISDKLKAAVLVFRGTLDVLDMITDAHAVLKNWPGDRTNCGRAHAGFGDGLDLVWGRIRERLEGIAHPVFFTGHSLGAALATLAAARAVIEGQPKRPAAIYTFGSPRVGDLDFMKNLAVVPHYRMVNRGDVATTAPPPLPYLHDGELHHLLRNGTIEVRPRARGETSMPSTDVFINQVVRLVNDLVGGLGLRFGLPEQLIDHTPVNYTAHLEATGG